MQLKGKPLHFKSINKILTNPCSIILSRILVTVCAMLLSQLLILALVYRYVNEFEGALISKSFANPVTGYKPYIDMGSFVDYFLVSEITKNPDSYRGSAFIHKVMVH